jgi:hypothetical protein
VAHEILKPLKGFKGLKGFKISWCDSHLHKNYLFFADLTMIFWLHNVCSSTCDALRRECGLTMPYIFGGDRCMNLSDTSKRATDLCTSSAVACKSGYSAGILLFILILQAAGLLVGI